MSYKNEANKAIKRAERIIWEWEENWTDTREACDLLVPDIKTIIHYLKRLQNEVDELKKKSHD